MKPTKLAQALHRLRPNYGFGAGLGSAQKLEEIKWPQDADIPTDGEVHAEIKKIETEESLSVINEEIKAQILDKKNVGTQTSQLTALAGSLLYLFETLKEQGALPNNLPAIQEENIKKARRLLEIKDEGKKRKAEIL